MASGTKLLSITRLRNDSAYYRHAMPCGLMKLIIEDVTGKNSGPIFVFAQGRIVPISRGSPPTTP
jgi:hypothetical protein